jgi:hypothetical protein
MNRNTSLNHAAFELGGLASALKGWMTEERVWQILLSEALKTGLETEEVIRTIASGWAAGVLRAERAIPDFLDEIVSRHAGITPGPQSGADEAAPNGGAEEPALMAPSIDVGATDAPVPVPAVPKVVEQLFGAIGIIDNPRTVRDMIRSAAATVAAGSRKGTIVMDERSARTLFVELGHAAGQDPVAVLEAFDEGWIGTPSTRRATRSDAVAPPETVPVHAGAAAQAPSPSASDVDVTPGVNQPGRTGTEDLAEVLDRAKETRAELGVDGDARHVPAVDSGAGSGDGVEPAVDEGAGGPETTTPSPGEDRTPGSRKWTHVAKRAAQVLIDYRGADGTEPLDEITYELAAAAVGSLPVGGDNHLLRKMVDKVSAVFMDSLGVRRTVAVATALSARSNAEGTVWQVVDDPIAVLNEVIHTEARARLRKNAPAVTPTQAQANFRRAVSVAGEIVDFAAGSNDVLRRVPSAEDIFGTPAAAHEGLTAARAAGKGLLTDPATPVIDQLAAVVGMALVREKVSPGDDVRVADAVRQTVPAMLSKLPKLGAEAVNAAAMARFSPALFDLCNPNEPVGSAGLRRGVRAFMTAAERQPNLVLDEGEWRHEVRSATSGIYKALVADEGYMAYVRSVAGQEPDVGDLGQQPAPAVGATSVEDGVEMETVRVPETPETAPAAVRIR